MRSWGLAFKPRGGIAGTGFGAAVVASVVSACAPIRPVLLPGRKTREHSVCGSGSSPLPVLECGVWAWGAESAASLPFQPPPNNKVTIR